MPLLHAALGWNYVLVTALCGSFLAQFIKVILNLSSSIVLSRSVCGVRAACPAPTRPPYAPW